MSIWAGVLVPEGVDRVADWAPVHRPPQRQGGSSLGHNGPGLPQLRRLGRVYTGFGLQSAINNHIP